MGEFLKKLASFREFALDITFPKYCIGCGVEGCYLCPRCLRKLPRLSPLNCPRCGLALGNSAFCPRCEQISWRLDSLHSVFRFEGLVRQAIHLLKYNNYKALAPVLAEHAYSLIKTIGMRADAILPVPLHPARIKERGYNQSSIIARHLAKLSGIPVMEGYLLRVVNTPPQVRTLNREERIKNIQGAFICKNQGIKGNIILFDDVCTTGATLNACAATLKKNLAVSVHGLTLAREI